MENISFRNALEMENAICHERSSSKALSFGKMPASDSVGVKAESSDFVLTILSYLDNDSKAVTH
jgi:hypothetical protein